MNRLIVLFFILIFAQTVFTVEAQNNFSDAFSRMDSAFDSFQDDFFTRDIYFLGRAAAAHLLGLYPLYTEKPATTEYLNLICNALVINSPLPNSYAGFHVMILDTPVINAFATPGGHIFLTRGILELAASEDMLAAIIAHEIAHVQLKHGMAVISHSNLVQNLNQESQQINESLNRETSKKLFTAAVDEFLETLIVGGYSQLQEFEADSTAFTMLVSAGYYPGSFIDMLRLLERTQGDHTGSLNSTHPQPAHRISNLQRQMNSYRAADNSSIRKARFSRIMGR